MIEAQNPLPEDPPQPRENHPKKNRAAPEPAYQSIAQLAAGLCQAPVALITLVDGQRHQLKAVTGLDVTEALLAQPFLDTALSAGQAILHVPDAAADPRFANSALVAAPPAIRFYAGASVEFGGEGAAILSVLDTAPRPLAPENRAALLMLAQTLAAHLAIRHKHDELLAENGRDHLYLANVAHELRAPMNAILAVVSFLAGTELTPQQRQYLDIIVKSGRHLLAITSQILEHAKLEHGLACLEEIAFDLHQVLDDQVAMLTPLAAEKSLSLDAHKAPGLHRYVKGDQHRFSQIIFNLAGNGLKFTSVGGVKIKASSEFLQDNIAVHVSVHDTGCGIPKSHHGKLFKPFSQGTPANKKTASGTGLGLSISRRLCRMMGGDISFESEEGKGSVFSFSVTFKTPAPSEIEAHSQTSCAACPTPCCANRRFLIAEDVLSNQFVIARILASFGGTYDIAGNGAEAIDRALNGNYDAIFMDCRLPILDGYEATARIRKEERKHNLIFALTASILGDEHQQCLAAGMDDFIAKPFNTETIASLLNRWLPAE